MNRRRKGEQPAGSILGRVKLRTVRAADLPFFFDIESDPGARWMAAFGNDPTDSKAFARRWRSSLRDPTCRARTVLLDGRVVGHVAKFELLGKPSVGYSYARKVWGQGVATVSLREFLRVVPTRPLFARVVNDNFGSVRVLEKCGFALVGTEKTLSKVRDVEVEELIYRRDDP